MLSICPVCEDMREIEIIKKREISVIKGVEITSDVEYSVCRTCRNEFSTADQMDYSLTNAFSKYREIEDIITPEEIIRIRSKYNASQKAFAKILDLGELTINSYEQGSLCSKAVSNLIRMVDKPENFIRLYHKNKGNLSVHQRKKIEASQTERKVPLYTYDPDMMAEHVGEADQKYTGYTRPDWEKLIAMFQLILHFAGKKLFKMAILKIAFYCDFTAFSRNTCSITGWPYVALPYGPVPDEWKSILQLCDDNKMLQSEIDEITSGALYSLPEMIEIEQVEKLFLKEELETIREVTERLKDKTPTELTELTHKEPAWIETSNAKRIDYSYAQNLQLGES